MSAALNKFCIMEPRLAFSDSMIPGNYSIIKGAETYTYRNYTSSSCDNSGINFNTPPPSMTDVLSRLAILEVPVNLKFVGPGTISDPDQAMIQTNRDAFRAFPLESIIKNMTIGINSENISCNINQVVHPFSRYYLDKQKINEGITPNMLDTFAKYSDADGTSKNPLAWYSDNSAQNPRGAYTDYEIVENTNTSAEIRATLRTYIMMSPFEWLSASNNVVPGLTQLTSLDWNINFASNLSRIWSRSDTHPVPVSNVQVTIGSLSGMGSGNANLRLLWMTPRPQMVKYIRSMPEIKYPYFTTTRYTTTGKGFIAPNDVDDITSQVINFMNVPNAIYVYAIRDESTYINSVEGNLTTTDTFGSIENLDITIANVTGVLSTCTPQDLYNISVRAGLQDTTFNEFNGITNPFNQLVSTFSAGSKIGLTGSVIRLSPGVDFSLRPGLVQGVQEKVDFQITVRVRNINQTESIRFQLAILCVFEGYLQIYNGLARASVGPLTVADAECDTYARLDWNDLEKNYGGALGDKFKTLGRNVYKYASDANKVLKNSKAISKGLKAASYAPTRFSSTLRASSDVAKSLGYGMDGGCGDCNGGMLFEEQRGLVGGRQMAHRELKSRLKKRN